MTSLSQGKSSQREISEGNRVTMSNEEDMTVDDNDNTTNHHQPTVNTDVGETEPDLGAQYSITVVGGNAAKSGATLPVSIMRFTGVGVDPGMWKGCRMIRDIKRSSSKVVETAVAGPTEGGGSEYRSEVREEIQRRKMENKYRKKPVVTEDQPWLMRVTDGEKKKKRFRGTKVGGLNDYGSYYAGRDNGVQAIPITRMFDFKSIEGYNNLTAEEAEETFLKRNKTYNYFSIMTRKRLRNEDTTTEKENFRGGSAKRTKQMTTSSASAGVNSEQEEAHKWSDSSEEEGDGKRTGRNKKNGVTDEDDGSEREVDYMSSSDDSSSDDGNEEGETQEDGDSQLLKSSSDSESESDEKSDEV